jgi:hypothetical protein
MPAFSSILTALDCGRSMKKFSCPIAFILVSCSGLGMALTGANGIRQAVRKHVDASTIGSMHADNLEMLIGNPR